MSNRAGRNTTDGNTNGASGAGVVTRSPTIASVFIRLHGGPTGRRIGTVPQGHEGKWGYYLPSYKLSYKAVNSSSSGMFSPRISGMTVTTTATAIAASITAPV